MIRRLRSTVCPEVQTTVPRASASLSALRAVVSGESPRNVEVVDKYLDLWCRRQIDVLADADIAPLAASNEATNSGNRTAKS